MLIKIDPSSMKKADLKKASAAVKRIMSSPLNAAQLTKD